MCIICIKPIDCDMPDNRTLNTMWQANSDGAGFSYWRPEMNTVVINKGFMKLKALKAALNALEFTKADLVILHFRWATHGLTDEGNCHPFPLSNKIAALRAISGHFPTAIAHNGVFGNMACHETLSDTQKFISKVMCSPLVARNLEDPSIRELIGGYCGSSSKLSIMRPGKVILIGEFEKDDKTGLVYSNGGYKTTRIYGYHNKNKDFPDDEDIDDGEYITNANAHAASCNCNACVELNGKYIAIPKQCELCACKKEVEYIEEYQLFLCDKCYEWNWAQDMKHNRMGSEIDIDAPVNVNE